MPLSPGVVVGGDFRVLSRLRAGGMGSVWVAEQLSVGRKRALKVMHREIARDARLRERFVQEARIGASIDSDHVVEVAVAERLIGPTPVLPIESNEPGDVVPMPTLCVEKS